MAEHDPVVVGARARVEAIRKADLDRRNAERRARSGLEKRTSDGPLGALSREELQDLWEQADNSGGRAGGFTQGAIWQALQKKG